MLGLTVLCAIAVACATTAVPGRSSEQRVTISQVSGTLQLTNSRSGQTIFQPQGLTPGRSVSGTVQLSNTGTLAGDLSLAQADVADQPGANGGRLSNGVHLDIEDVTGGSSIPVFAGRLATVGTRSLGPIAPGEARTYRFTASLGDTGVPLNPVLGDNIYKGSGVTARYVWTATAPDEPGGTDGGGTGGGGTDAGTGGTSIVSTPPKLWFRVDNRRLLTKGWLDVFVRCNRGCTLDAWAQFRKTKGVRVRHRHATLPLPEKTARIRLKLRPPAQRALGRAVASRRRVVRVSVRMLAAGWGDVRTYTKNVSVGRPKPKRARR
jgi:hypothetical protein